MNKQLLYAFRKWHSCETQLAAVINDWAKILDNKGQEDTFILDFEKAFDTPTHELLKSKLFSYGIGGKTLKWINAFLCVFHFNSFVIVTPRYLILSTFSRTAPSKV